MKRAKRKVFVLAVAMVLSSILAALTYSVLMETTGPVKNFFEAANVTTFKVNYDLNGAEGSVSSQSHIDVTERTEYDFEVKGLPDGFTREGYTFLGWAEDPNATAGVYQPGDTLTLSASSPEKTLCAIWGADRVFTLTYDYGYTGAPAPVTVSQTEPILREYSSFTVAEAPTRQYWLFQHWTDGQQTYAAGDQVRVDFDATTGVGTKTLQAVWAEDSTYKEYTVTFHNNLPSDAAAVSATAPTDLWAKVRADSHSFTVPGAPTVSSEDATGYGLVFEGWSTAADGPVEYLPGSQIALDATDTAAAAQSLYAVWSREYYIHYYSTVTDPAAVKYNMATGQAVDDGNPITVVSGESTLSAIAAYEASGFSYKRQGYVLVGFAGTTDGRTPLENVTISGPGSRNAVSVYAIWTEGSYALIYDANGGTGAPAAQTLNAAVTSATFSVLYSDTMVPHAGAYDARFLGWAYSPDAKTPDIAYDSAAGTFTPAQLTLTEDSPVMFLYAVWEYHYVLTFDKGYGDADSPLPEPLDAWSTADSYTFSIPDGPEPTRSQYEFMYFWSDTLDRQNSENRYYKSSMGSEFITTVTISSQQTHKTVYARFSPLGKSVLRYDANGGEGAPADYEVDKTSSWTIPVPVNTATAPTRTSYTFIGWSTDPKANHTWLQDPDKVIYGGKSSVTMYNMNTDISDLHTLYAVWAPTHTIEVVFNSNGGTGWYQTTHKVDCDYTWDSVTYEDNEDNYWYQSLPYSTYTTTNQITFSNIAGTADTKANAQDSAYYRPLFSLSRDGFILRGFSFQDKSASPEYSVANGNMTVNVGANVGSGTTSNGYLSGGTFSLKNVVVDFSDLELDLYTPKWYTFTLNAVWSPDSDFYRVVMVNPDTGAETEIIPETSVKISENGITTTTFPKSQLKSPYHVDGYICDYAVTPNATVADYTVESTWVPSSYGGDGDPIPTRSTVNQSWNIDQDITVSSTDDFLECTVDDDGAFIYTLKLYPVVTPGQIFEVTLDYTNSVATKPYTIRWKTVNLSREEPTVNTDTLRVTARAEDRSYTWAEKTLNWFYAHEDSSNYEFLGFSYTNRASTAAAVNYTARRTSTKHPYMLTTRSQYYQGIQEAVTVDREDTAHVTSTTNSAGIRINTLRLYPVWRPWKTFKVVFDTNGGNFDHLESSDKTDSDINLSVTKKTSLTTSHTFSGGTTVIYTPRRTGYRLLGYSYTQQSPVDDPANAVVDIHLTDSSTTNAYYRQEDITVNEADRTNGSGKTVTVNTGSAPNVTTLTVYAVWQRMQQYTVIFDHNKSTGTTTPEPVVVEPEVTYVDISSTGAGSVTNSGYVLLGYSLEKVDAGLGELSHVLYPINDDGSVGPVRVNKGTNPATNTVTTTDTDNVDSTVMTLYAVWASNATYYRVRIQGPGGTTTLGTLSGTTTGVTTEYTFSGSYSTLSTIESNKYGYRLAGLSFTEGGEIAYGITGGRLDSPILVQAGGQNVTYSESNSLGTYTLTLYPVWVQQNFFKLQISPNHGYTMNGLGSMIADTRSMTLSSTCKADVGQTVITLPNGYFNTYYSSSSYTIITRADHQYMGFAYSPDAVAGDYALRQVKQNNTNYYQYLDSVRIDLEDPNMDITASTDENGITTYTLTLYAAWRPYRHFELEFLPNGGTFHDATTGAQIDSHVIRSSAQEYPVESYRFTTASYTDYNAVSAVHPGYKLLGYSFTPDGPVDVTVTQSSKTVTVSNVTVNALDSGKTFEEYTYESADTGSIQVTRLKLYAVWGTQLNYKSVSGTTDMPATEIRYMPEATDNRQYAIPQLRPMNKSFIFLGWSTREGGTAEYGAQGFYEALSNESLPETITFNETTGEITLYAVWTQRYELYYHANGGDETTVPENETAYITSNQAAFEVSIRVPTRAPDEDGTEYVFLGWADTADAQAPVYSASDASLSKYILITGSSDGSTTQKHVYAVWDAVSSTVSDEPTDSASEEPTKPPSDESTDPPSDESTDPASDEPTDPPSDDPGEPSQGGGAE